MGQRVGGPVEVDPSEKRKTITALLLALGILQTLYMNLAAFFPIYAENHYRWIGPGQVGVVLAMFQVAYLLFSPVVGQNLQRFGRKNVILAGYCLCILATIGFGMCPIIVPFNCKLGNKGGCNDTDNDPTDSNSKLFFALSLVIRFIQGIGDSMVATASYSIVTIEFPHQRDIYIGYCQTAVGLGLLMGPVIGTTIYGFAGYSNTFFILGGVLAGSLCTAIFLLPARINKYSNDKPDEIVLEQNQNPKPSISGPRPQGIAERSSVNMVKLAQTSERYSRRSHVLMAQVSYSIFFTNLRAMTAIISAMFAMIFMLFYEPIFTKYLVDAYGVEEGRVGYFLAIGCFTYGFGSPLVGILCSKVKRRYITASAFLFCSLSLFLLGPSIILGFPATLGLTLSGIGFLGLSVAFLFVPLLPEIIAAVSEKEGLEASPFLCDKASGIYNSAYGVGNCLAPIIGGLISGSYADSKEGFRSCCDIMAISSLAFAFIYFFFGIIPAYLDDKKKAEKREQKLIEDLPTGNIENSLTLEFENNRGLNESDTRKH